MSARCKTCGASIPPTVLDGRPLRAALERADWTQQELADALGVRQITVSQWVTGRNGLRAKVAARIVEHFISNGHEPPIFRGSTRHDGHRLKVPRTTPIKGTGESP